MTPPPAVFPPDPVRIDEPALLTDLYEITMAASYWREAMTAPATFSLFVRRLPADRGYLVAAGLADVLNGLAGFRFSDQAIAYLDSLKRFDPTFLAVLRRIRFTGSVRAVPEGTLVFPDEPLLEVRAPIIEAQLVESLVLNAVHYQTLIATKASRCVEAACGRDVVEFGLRRAPGRDASLRAARAAWIAGAAATSNALAGHWLGIPVTGTMAHSYVTAFPSELDAFRAFAHEFPDHCVLLVDTFDTVAGTRKAATVGHELAEKGHRLQGVRLDSGDLAALSREVRRILDEAGLQDARIMASGGLDEADIAALIAAGAPIDSFGVGTRMDVSADAPYLDMAYKLVRYRERDVMKLSGRKRTWPGPKQVWRARGPDGFLAGDLVSLAHEDHGFARRPLLEPVMQNGVVVRPPRLDAARARCREQTAALSPATRRLVTPVPYPVELTPALRALAEQCSAGLRQGEVASWV